MSIQLRDIELDDLPILYEFQLDQEANRLAATIPRNLSEFNAHWQNSLKDSSVTAKAIVVGHRVAGCISCFESVDRKSDDRKSVGYWIGREFWGHGIATGALKLMLGQVAIRPLHARVASNNAASLRVLQKCGFKIIACQHSPADARYLECEEAILELRGTRRI